MIFCKEYSFKVNNFININCTNFVIRQLGSPHQLKLHYKYCIFMRKYLKQNLIYSKNTFITRKNNKLLFNS